jgi:hypothetical protein
MPEMVEFIVDRVTGKPVPNVGAEENRQRFERLLLEEKGYRPAEIEVDAPIEVFVAGEAYRSRVHLVVCRLMAVKCVAGSLGSWEREILAAARLLGEEPLPLAVVTDGKSAFLLETAGGKTLGQGMAILPTRGELPALAASLPRRPLDPARREREALIFRSYDSMIRQRMG